MEGLLRPVGPEEVRTYWIRRGAAGAVLLVLMISLGLIVSNLGRTEGNATAVETTAVPAPAAAAEPAIPQAPPPAQAPPGVGVPDAVSDEEAVPIPSSARALTAQDPSSAADDQTSDESADPQSGATLEPEPANTFHLTGGQGSGDEQG